MQDVQRMADSESISSYNESMYKGKLPKVARVKRVVAPKAKLPKLKKKTLYGERKPLLQGARDAINTLKKVKFRPASDKAILGKK